MSVPLSTKELLITLEHILELVLDRTGVFMVDNDSIVAVAVEQAFVVLFVVFYCG